jgi:hypothetical protein
MNLRHFSWDPTRHAPAPTMAHMAPVASRRWEMLGGSDAQPGAPRRAAGLSLSGDAPENVRGACALKMEMGRWGSWRCWEPFIDWWKTSLSPFQWLAKGHLEDDTCIVGSWWVWIVSLLLRQVGFDDVGVKLKNGKCILEGVTGRGNIGKTRLNLVGVNGSFVFHLLQSIGSMCATYLGGGLRPKISHAIFYVLFGMSISLLNGHWNRPD